jgi:hypothetical protein
METPAILNHISNVPTSSVGSWQSKSDSSRVNFGIRDSKRTGSISIKQTTWLGGNSANLSSEKTLLVDDIALSSVGPQIDIQ